MTNWLRRRLWTVRYAILTIWRSRFSFVLSVLAITTSLVLTGVAALLEQQIGLVEGNWHGKVDVNIYLCTEDSLSLTCHGETDRERTAELITKLRAFDGVRALYYESAEEAFNEFQRRFAGSELARDISPDALPASIRVKLNADVERHQLADAFRNLDGVETVQDQRVQLNGFFKLVAKIRSGALIFAALQAISAVTALAHLMRASIRHRRRDIEIMRLIGAAPSTVRGPFILEALLVTGTALALTWAVLSAGVNTLGPALTGDGDVLVRSVAAHEVAVVILWLVIPSLTIAWVISRAVLHRIVR